MIPSTKLSEYLYEMSRGGNRVGANREREGEREQSINGVRDRALEGFGNGVGSKWSLGKRTPEYFI